jgi:Polyketide cyclase / dehydrase and lipid transport
MATIIKEATINAPAQQCWEALRDFGALHERLARSFVTETNMVEDDEREITFFTGAVARERLVGLRDDHMRLAYAVVESALGSSQHSVSAQIIALDESRCRFVWITDVLPERVAPTVESMMDEGLKAITSTLEGRNR